MIYNLSHDNVFTVFLYVGSALIPTKPRKDPQSTSVTAQRAQVPRPPFPPPTTFTRSSHPGFAVLLTPFMALRSFLPASFLLSNRVSSSCSSLSSSPMLANRTCFFLTTLSRSAEEDIPVTPRRGPEAAADPRTNLSVCDLEPPVNRSLFHPY